MSHLYLLGVATLTLTSASFAGTDTNADLQARLEAAEARINELSAATNNNWLNDARANEVRGLVHDVLADADTRASLQGSGATAGYNGGFTIGSADGNWSMKINGLLQTRWEYEDSDDDDAFGTGVSTSWGFNTNRAYLTFSGTIAGDFGYSIRHDVTNSGGNATEEEWAWGSVGLGDGWSLRMGDMLVANSRAQLIDSGNLMTLDRAENWERAIGTGISLDYVSDDIRAWIQLFNNADLAGTTTPAVGTGNDSSSLILGRVEFMVDGNWAQFDQIHSNAGDADGMLFGLTYWTADGGDTSAAGSNDAVQGDGNSSWTADVLCQWGGSSLYVGWTNFAHDTTATSDTDDLQAVFSMDLDDNWEAYVRYADQNDNLATPQLDGEVWSIGLNNYWAGQNAKWTIEVSWDDEHAAGADDTTTIGSQLQFMF